MIVFDRYQGDANHNFLSYFSNLCSDFRRAKLERRKLSMVTCYDYTFARLLNKSGVDALLVGDSAGMVMHGHSSTVAVSLDLMRLHTEAVVRGAPDKFIVVDLPFLSFRKGVGAALDAVQTLMSAGANAVKLEGVDGHEDVIQRIAQSGIPVMGHLGMQPQSIHAYGGFKIQGRTPEAAREITREAKRVEELGAFAVVLECIPTSLAQEITDLLGIPTIGMAQAHVVRTDSCAAGLARHECRFPAQVCATVPRWGPPHQRSADRFR